MGQRESIKLALAALIARGHVLLEASPGTGKTTMAKALAAACGVSSNRLQCTPDLLPGDVTGVGVFNPSTTSFEFRPGPVFTNLLHADELNRATPKAQSALLEAMEERQVTVDGVTHRLPSPFFVIATQNPAEHAGTYSLPDAQLDRFAVRVALEYPDREASRNILSSRRVANTTPTAVTDAKGLEAMSNVADHVWVDPSVAEYITDLILATRTHPSVAVGASPRASLVLLRVAAAHALLDARPYVSVDDVKAMTVPVLAHRLSMKKQAAREGVSQEDVLRAVLGALRPPKA